MKHLFIAGFLITAIHCHSGVSVKHNPFNYNGVYKIDQPALQGSWQLQPVLASDTASGRIPTLNFDILHKAFTGNSGCNAMSGSFTLKDEWLSFNQQVISAKMACPGYNEKAFYNNLMKTNRYLIKDGTLQLMYNTTTLSNWVRHADTSTTKKI